MQLNTANCIRSIETIFSQCSAEFCNLSNDFLRVAIRPELASQDSERNRLNLSRKSRDHSREIGPETIFPALWKAEILRDCRKHSYAPPGVCPNRLPRTVFEPDPCKVKIGPLAKNI